MNEIRFDEPTTKMIQTLELLINSHSITMACHCECLAMNAENMWAAIANDNPVYRSQDYFKVMQKWGIMDSHGNSKL